LQRGERFCWLQKKRNQKSNETIGMAFSSQFSFSESIRVQENPVQSVLDLLRRRTKKYRSGDPPKDRAKREFPKQKNGG